MIRQYKQKTSTAQQPNSYRPHILPEEAEDEPSQFASSPMDNVATAV